MIAHIEGKIIHKEDRMLIVATSGVGRAVFVTPETAEHQTVGGETALWTHLSVRENALELYGFPRREELALFRLLIGISGIGPKSAINVLSLADHDTLVHAINRGDAAYLTKVSGIGKKLAEKIVLELKDKVGKMAEHEGAPRAEDEALEALEALGYPLRDTREIVRTIAKKHATPQEIIRKALQTLGGR
ncbi:MAG: Holliday junction DNA helicase RuvA [Candidatus Lloydbacteria bacterium RIFCSPLOWO2_01_FULL_50_20]|uniref:Holliday junction branch migration complex subunit RuvA n=1 Tax=Candidatus Lloydbacteria bacterium RIFCSPLOWO2_01_FULL_50_20 TaxID=1798665 RepID=A0A1G2DJD5_9BACT|nr:MAG: Holliday junction DNA helicase RuvA [Candidatus Lloydbacteria bacterium RIFCSPHIGHO2_02_FULL_50_11]OGZ12980.1 MAG: Holliday junction DNA helicase RuvA [Candidatus Lloydbacteria bacterium RIFCSPLOWO2_01_FULL_50_20]